MITLLANGCSHTAGAEIEYPLQDKCYINAWPRWLADSMGWDWINLAESGNSNEQIKRTTIEWIIENIELTNRYKPEELVVMIMWSGFDRFEIWNDQVKQLRSCSALTSNIKNFPMEIFEYIKYKTIIENSGVNEYKNLMDVYLTSKYLELLNIKYYFMNGVSRWHPPNEYEPKEMLPQYQRLVEAYVGSQAKHLGFFSLEERFYQYLKDQQIPFSEYSTHEHWGVDGHKAWKENVKAWMARIDS